MEMNAQVSLGKMIIKYIYIYIDVSYSTKKVTSFLLKYVQKLST